MITSFNPENKVQLDLYTKLFSEAYAELKEAKVENLPERGYFATLDEYFAHMGDIISLDDPSRYILLPLDETSEGIFTINANDRTIAIPSQFSKCGAVQNDEKCEIAVFTIDRYFDFQDLDLTQICVQWVNADNEPGISHIKYRDLKTYPGKLRFGWPLTSNITKKEGPVQFSVRFYKRDDEDKIAYILNTLPATLTVKKSLNVVNPIIEEDATSLFHKFIENSQNPAYELAKNPFFVKPGKDIVATNYSGTGFGAIDEESNELSFSAQAVANDLGAITYEWKYKALNNEGNFADPVILADGADYEVTEQKPVEVARDADGKIVRQGCQKYYIKDAEGALIPYFDDEFPENETFYTIDTVLKINNTSNENIVGKYYVEATNTLGENHSQAISSSEILVPAPQTIVIKKDIPEHIFIEKADGVQLSVEVEKDANGPKVECEWFGLTNGTNEPKSANDITTSVGKGWSSELITIPGWYTTIVTSTLNRKVRSTNEEGSAPRKICKVTNLPAAPVAQEFSYKIGNGEWIVVTDGDDEDSKLDTIIPANAIELGTKVSFKVNTNLDNTTNKLESEKLEYLWYVQEPENTTYRLLTEKDVDNNGLVISGLNTNTLTVRCVSDGATYNYYCIIKNYIQDKFAELDTSPIYTFTIA